MKRNKNRNINSNYEPIKNRDISGKSEWIEDIKQHPFAKFVVFLTGCGILTVFGFLFQLKGFLDDQSQFKQKEIKEARAVIESMKGRRVEGGRIKALQTLVKYEESIEGENLSSAVLKGIKLGNVKLTKIIFNEADLSNADMNYAHMDHAQLIKSKFGNANMSNADLTEADLHDADFNNAKLTNANMAFTQLEGTRFNGADLRGANLEGATIGCSDFCTDFQGAENLTVEQITKAKGWEQACYDEKISNQLPTRPQNENCHEK
jgi:hypothetical protein